MCKKLLHGAMIARNAQRKGDESDCPADGEIVFIHTGFEKSMKDAEKLFRPETARKDAPIGAEQKEVTVIFSDSSILQPQAASPWLLHFEVQRVPFFLPASVSHGA